MNLKRPVGHAIGRIERWAQIRARVDDRTILLADFSKSGIGWVRFVVCTALHFHRTGEFRKVERALCKGYAGGYTAVLDGAWAPGRKLYYFGHNSRQWTLLKTHWPYHPRFRRAIFIFRNPYEAIRSMYSAQSMANNLPTKDTPAWRRLGTRSVEERFLLDWCRRYVDYHRTWLPPLQRHPERYLVVHYERMLRETEAVIRDVLSFLGLLEGLPSDALPRLADMYTRTDTVRDDVDKEAWFRRKADIFERVTPILSEATLRRLAPALCDEVTEMYEALQSLRRPGVYAC